MKPKMIALADWEMRALLRGDKVQLRRPLDVPSYLSSIAGDLLTTAKLQLAFPSSGKNKAVWQRDEIYHVSEHLYWYSSSNTWRYTADSANVHAHEDDQVDMMKWLSAKKGRTCSALQMPLWASRYTITIDNVWPHKVKDMQSEDVMAEGINRGDFEYYWNQTYANKGYAFQDNPWVVAAAFTAQSI